VLLFKVMLVAFFIGLVLGFFASVPLAGPTAGVVVSRSLDNQARAGLFVAVGSAVGESFYSFLAFLGVTAVMSRFPFMILASRLLGSMVVVGVGVYFVLRRTDKAPERHHDAEGARNFLLGFTMAIVNPTLLVSWAAAVSIAHATGLLRVNALDAFAFAGGVAVGIVSWFATLLRLMERFRSRIGPTTMDRLIKWMGAVLIVCGIGLAVRVLATAHS
jgi:threonine/homoserine/homoserine lactone efflux protein